jgi:hypothetical protein
MQVTLTRHAAELLDAEIARTGGSPEEVVERALEQLAERTVSVHKAPAEAVMRLRQLRTGLTLGDLAIADLIREGRKY